jgi:hypothetical protein
VNKRTISNEEFIELWKVHKSAAKIARITGISERNVHHRRRDIEAKYDTTLVASSNKNTVAQAYGHINLGMENGTVIVFSDAHFQLGRRTTAFKALLWLIGELKPKVVINNGDAFDGAQASRHPANGWDVTPTIIQELNACKMFLGEIQEAAGDAKLIFTLGNHDARFSTRLATVAPEFQGVEGFRLEDHFPDWQHVVSCMVNDSLMVKHRWRSGVHAVHNNAVGSGVSFCTGHLHSAKVTPWTDYTGTRYGVDCGTLAEPFGDQFMYAENNSRNWRSAFAVLNIVDGHLLMPELCMVSSLGDDYVEWRGELVDVSEF